MAGVGGERSEPPSSSTRAGRGGYIPPQQLRRVLVDSMATPAGPSSSDVSGRGKMKRGSRGEHGGGRGRKAVVPSSPPPEDDSPDHWSAPSQVEPSDLDPSRTLVHEPRADEPRVAEPSPQETRAPESSSHETPVPECSS